MIRFFIRRPAMVTLLLMLVVVTGLLSVSSMIHELWPPVEINEVLIETWYPGASPEEVERLVTIPIEDELEGLDDLDYVQSSSAEGRSVVDVVFKADVGDEAMDDRARDVQQRVNRVTDLPDDATTPLVEKIATENIPVAILAVSGPREELVTKKLADDLADELDDLPGMRKVWITGTREREIAIRVDPVRLEGYGLTIEDVRQAVARRHVNIPAGSLFEGDREVLLRVLGKPEDVAGLGEVVVRAGPGGPIHLRDVAVIEDTFKDPVVLSHLNGRRCVMVMMAKEKLASTTGLVDSARKVIEEFRSTHPELAVELVFDTSIYVRLRLSELVTNGIQGFFLVLAILWSSLGWRRGLIVALGIPTSFLATLVVMKAADISLNFMTLYGMFVVLGILVDDAIVVVENITRLSEQGLPPRRAALEGTRQVALPVIIAVTTTMVAFSTMLLMTGVLGRFMGYLPKVVLIVLGFSLLESLLMVPSHVAEWVPREPEGGTRHAARTSLTWLQDRVELSLRFLLRRPWLGVLLPPGLLLGCLLVAARFIQVEMFPPEEPDQIYITFELPPGSSIEATEQKAYEVERRVSHLDLPEVATTYAAVGYSMEQEFATGSQKNLGQVICVLQDRSVRRRSGFTVAEELRGDLTNRFAGVEYLRVGVPGSGPPAGKPVYVRLMGEDFTVLEAIAEEIKAFVAGRPGVINLDDDRRDGNPEIELRLDEVKAARSGVDFGTLATTVRGLFVGIKAVERRIDDENVDLTVRGPQSLRRVRQALSQATVPGLDGAPVSVAELVEIRHSRGPVSVRRREGKHLVTVGADIRQGPNGPEANATEINQAIAEKFLKSVPREYPGYRIEFGGEAQEQAESFGSLGIAFVAAMMLIYGLLVLQFNTLVQPFVIMFTVPMSFLGVVAGMLLFGERFTLSHGIGIVALVGIAVNDAVVYVDFINQLRAAGWTGHEALIEAARTRLRPILLTSLTTVAGLLPMALRLGGGSAYLSPLASTIIYGLTSQTLFTVLFIPVALMMVERGSDFLNRHVVYRILPEPDPDDAV